MLHQDPEDPPDLLDLLVNPESTDPLANLALPLSPLHHNPAILVQSEILARKDLPDLLVLLVPMVNLARKDLLDLPEKLANLDEMVNKDLLVHLDRLDHLANGESARNTALWTAEFSSKMEHGGKRARARLYTIIKKGYVKKIEKIIYRSFCKIFCLFYSLIVSGFFIGFANEKKKNFIFQQSANILIF